MAYSDNISRLSRLTAILLKLQSKPFVNVQQLAEQFEVSTRTIYRDLGSLEQAGVPLISEEGRGYGLMEGYHIPPVMFTESEANALIIAEKFISRSEDASLIEEFNKAIDKIKSVLRQEDKQKVELLAERTIIGKNWDNRRSSAYLSDIQGALTNYHPIRISYKKKNQTTPTQRVVEPYAIYHNTSEHWVLIAWCRLREEFRTFRIDRISHLLMLDETFSPHQISLQEYVEIQRKKFSQNPLT
ncbi:MAG: YafY family protein [Bacteroidota bacterium]